VAAGENRAKAKPPRALRRRLGTATMTEEWRIPKAVSNLAAVETKLS
jgi:hypothetical protein